LNRIAYRVVRIAYAQISTDKKDTDDYRDSGKFIQISMYFAPNEVWSIFHERKQSTFHEP